MLLKSWQRDTAFVLQCLQHDLGPNLRNLRVGQQVTVDEVREALQIACADVEDVVGIPRDRESRADHRLAGDKRSEFFFASLAVAAQVYPNDCAEAVAHAQLSCRAFTAEFIDCYLALAGTTVLSSVGGYAIEGLGVHLFDRVEGEHSTILGLPMIELLRLLREHGALER